MPALPDLRLEFELLQGGFELIAGIDEAGRGAWAGPIAAGMVILPVERFDLATRLRGVRDSKVMSPEKRLFWDEELKKLAVCWSIGMVDAGEVDELGIISSTRLAMRRALQGLEVQPEFLLIDYILLPEVPLPQTALPRGDSSVLSISSASILAKVARDKRMLELERRYPGYGFARHKGYGTAQHREALSELGPSRVHRRSFEPVSRLAN